VLLAAFLSFTLLAGCFPDELPVPSSPRATTTPTPARTTAPAAAPSQKDLPLPDLPPPPSLAPPYPIPPGSRVTLTGQVSTGAVVKVGSDTSELNRDTVLKLGDPKSPLYGFELNIPAASHKDVRTYTISYAPINSTTFKNVSPVSPLIIVENGGGYANELVTVKIPVKLAADEFAMGFYYDAKTSQLEGLPLLAADATSVTVATRHFSSIFASAIKLSILDALIMNGELDSGFRPGTDDWQFVNRGSYIAPGGHCAGQTLSALWYYVTRPDGPEANLWERYDRNGQKPGTPAIWQDDNQAYRFVSTIQAVEWNDRSYKLFMELMNKSDALTFRAFAYAIHVTGEPQQVFIWSSQGGVHAIIVYRIEGTKMFVADPNAPGDGTRRIEYDAAKGRFKPYDGQTKANKPVIPYETIGYFAKTAIVDWNIIAARWQEMKAGKAGNDLFPDYSFRYFDEKVDPQDYTEGMVTTQRYLYIKPVFDTGVGHAYYFRDGVRIPFDANYGIELKPGRNTIGAAAYGMPVPATKDLEYVDFTTLDITYVTLAIDPTVIRAQVNQDCAFTASMPNAPAGVRYDWLVNGARQQTGSSTTYRFRSTTAGTFDIGLKTFDSTGKEMGSASASAVISAASPTATTTPRPTTTTPPATTATPASRLSQLQKRTIFSASVGTADGTLNYRIEYPGSTRAARTFTASGGSWNTGVGDGIKITWSGASFSGTDTVKSSNSTKTTTRTVNGTVSADGNTITSLTFSVASRWPETENKEITVVAQNLSLARYWGDSSSLFISGAQAASVIGKVTEKTERAYDASSKSFTEVMTLISVDWKGSDRNSAGASFE
jgi:hypothetical protein